MLIIAITILGLAALAGGLLAAPWLMMDEDPDAPVSTRRDPRPLGWRGTLHGIGAALGLAALISALAHSPPPAHAIRLGAGGFGLFAACLLGLAFVAGLAILLLRLRRRSLPVALVATHGLIAITGYTLLVTYLTMLH